MDGHELLGRQAGADVEVADGVGDRDDRGGPAHEEPVDVPERAEQVAVVVVARGKERAAKRARGDRSVDVGVDHVGVEEVDLLGAGDTGHRGCETRRDIEAARDTLPRDLALVERAMEPRRVLARVEREEARIDTTFAQRGQQLEQVLLGAADPLHLRQVEDSHRVSSSR